MAHRDEGRSTDGFISDSLEPKSVEAYILSFDKKTPAKGLRSEWSLEKCVTLIMILISFKVNMQIV